MVPGTASVEGLGPSRALFLDRDGVINVNHGYVHTPERTDWVPGIFELCAAARDAGYVLVVVTNQAGIARGLYSESDFHSYTQWVHQQFESRGVSLLATYYCPHHPVAGIGDYRVECHCRKPQPGMLLAAQADWNVDPRRSCIIGDQSTDLKAAEAAGVMRGWRVGLEGISLPEAREALLAAEVLRVG